MATRAEPDRIERLREVIEVRARLADLATSYTAAGPLEATRPEVPGDGRICEVVRRLPPCFLEGAAFGSLTVRAMVGVSFLAVIF